MLTLEVYLEKMAVRSPCNLSFVATRGLAQMAEKRQRPLKLSWTMNEASLVCSHYVVRHLLLQNAALACEFWQVRCETDMM